MTAAARTVVVAGSGPSLLCTDVARIPRDAAIVRVNNFFLEPTYVLGRRVDLVYFSADPRAVRFYTATLRAVIARGEYDVLSSASHLPQAARHRPPEPFTRVGSLGGDIDALLADIRAREGVVPTSGAMAMLHAYTLGADRILLAGVDLYTADKYAFATPPRLARMLQPTRSSSGYDTRLHSRTADQRAIEWLIDRGVSLERTATEPLAGLHLPLAPLLPAEAHLEGGQAKAAPRTEDWVGRDGLWTVQMLAGARALRRWTRLGSQRRRRLAREEEA